MHRSVEEAVQAANLPTEAERVALRDKLENTFNLSTITEYHTIKSDCLKNTREVNDYVKMWNLLYPTSVAGEVSQGDVTLEDVHQLWSRHNHISISSLVRNGFEVKLSEAESYISKDGKIIFDVKYITRGEWETDIRAYQGEGEMKVSRAESTRNIIKKLRDDAVKSSRDADGTTPTNFKALDRNQVVALQLSSKGKYQPRGRRSKKNKAGFNSRRVPWLLDLNFCIHEINSRKPLLFEVDEGYNYITGGVLLGNKRKIQLKEVEYSNELKISKISLSALAEDGYEFKFTKKEALITKKGKLYLRAPLVGNNWIYNSNHERNGWLDGKCPYERKEMIAFEKKYGNEFTREEIVEAFKEFTHECEIEGARKHFLK